jgi:purine-cytosine permease-like protein
VGTVAVVPIITYHVYVIWKARKDAHAVAQGVVSGILLCANTVWMFGDFFFGHDQLRNVARWVFTIGMILGLLFFIYILRKDSSGDMHHQLIRAQLYKHRMTVHRVRQMEEMRHRRPNK